ncbi:MAG: alpha/beta hydrolase [Betaproteobacteria bacterium]|nr:MAG: alpha/beta hydrolase [Betaproteobacteria bacterium]
MRNTMTDLQAATGTSHFVEANGVRLHYLDYGVAGRPPMLCVHGAAAHAHWFDFVAPGLTPNHHVRALDLRGHGDSVWADQQTYSVKTFADDLNAVVEELDLRDFVLIGHSMGGMVSLVYAATHPGQCARLIVVDSIMLMPMERILHMREFGLTAPSSYATREELVARYRLNPPETHIAAPEVIHRMAMHSGRQGSDGRWQHKADRRVYANAEQVAGMPLWEHVTIPALVIKGEHSTRFGPKEVAEIRQRAPQVKMAEVAASNHHIPLDNPLGFVDVVQEFLRT